MVCAQVQWRFGCVIARLNDRWCMAIRCCRSMLTELMVFISNIFFRNLRIPFELCLCHNFDMTTWILHFLLKCTLIISGKGDDFAKFILPTMNVQCRFGKLANNWFKLFENDANWFWSINICALFGKILKKRFQIGLLAWNEWKQQNNMDRIA